MGSYIVIDDSTEIIVNRIMLDDPDAWEVPEGQSIVEDTVGMVIGGSYVDGVYTPPPVYVNRSPLRPTTWGQASPNDWEWNPMAAVDLIKTASNDEFSGRVMMIAFKVAQNVASEDAGTAEHVARVDYAERIMRGDDKPNLMSAHVISSNPTIGMAIEDDPTKFGSNVPDGDIEFALASIWTARALAFADAAA